MTPEQQKQLNDLTAAVQALTTFMQSMQSATSMSNNVEGAIRDRIFKPSTQDKDTFTTTITGGVILSKRPDLVIEVDNGIYVNAYRKIQ